MSRNTAESEAGHRPFRVVWLGEEPRGDALRVTSAALRVSLLVSTRWSCVRRRAAAVALLGLAACGGGPTDPGSTSVASIIVSSPIGSIIAVAGSAQLAAQARDQGGRSISRTFSWTAGDPAIATVSPAGVLTGVGAGTTTITAAADGVNGRLSVTVADADLPALQVVLEDPFADGLLQAIGGSVEAALRATWSACGAATSAGNLGLVNACIDQARADLDPSSDPEKAPLVSLIELFVDGLQRLLNLP
jgi:Big-like domain-containing protein